MVFDTFDDLLDEETSQQLEETIRRDHEFPQEFVPEPPIIGETGADTIIPVREIGEDPSKEQFDALEGLELADPFTLTVEAPKLAGEDSYGYGVTAFYGGFLKSPNDRLFGPLIPLSFDKNGIASVTIGSAGTDADVTTWIAFGPVSGDASLINNIEVPKGAERVAVQTTSDTGTPADSGPTVQTTGTEEPENGFTEVTTVESE